MKLVVFKATKRLPDRAILGEMARRQVIERLISTYAVEKLGAFKNYLKTVRFRRFLSFKTLKLKSRGTFF